MTDQGSDVNTVANSLYGGTTPAASAARGTALTPGGWPPASATPTEPVDARVFGDEWQPQPIAADATLQEKLYPSHVGMGQVLHRHLDTVTDVLGYGQAQRETLFGDVADAIGQAQLEPYTVGGLFAATIVEALAAQRQGTQPDTARMLQQEEDFRREYRMLLGSAERAERLFDEMASFIEQHPKLHRLMQTPGFAAAPSAEGFMRNLAEHVRKLKHV